LLVIEDCAQAYSGKSYQGDSRADVSMFSFGPIKTNTALSGGVLQVRNSALRESMLRQHDQWKIQSRFTFARRIAKYAFVKTLSTRIVCGGIYRAMKLFGSNHDGVASTMARGFAGPGFFQKIRKQPSSPLFRLLNHKLSTYQASQVEMRREYGQFVDNALGRDVFVLGASMNRQTWWVFPLLVEHPEALVQRLWDAGFDASNNCSLHAIFEGDDSVARTILRHIVFLPLHTDMPKSELSRMARVVRDAHVNRPDFLTKSEQRLSESSGDAHCHPARTSETPSALVSTAVDAVSDDSVGTPSNAPLAR
jgi:dTDP-4-amino-4,6-dideoxygalactose transaminase